MENDEEIKTYSSGIKSQANTNTVQQWLTVMIFLFIPSSTVIGVLLLGYIQFMVLV